MSGVGWEQYRKNVENLCSGIYQILKNLNASLQVMNRVHSYIEEKLVNKKWLALWRAKYDNNLPAIHSFNILVEVGYFIGSFSGVFIASND